MFAKSRYGAQCFILQMIYIFDVGNSESLSKKQVLILVFTKVLQVLYLTEYFVKQFIINNL